MSHYSAERELTISIEDDLTDGKSYLTRGVRPIDLDVSVPSSPNYKFREGQLLDELRAYIDTTYNQHYAGGKIQATEDIIDDGHGTGFCIGNAKKYLKRYGKKGETSKEWRKDIIKVLHYSLIQLYIHDLEHDSKVV